MSAQDLHVFYLGEEQEKKVAKFRAIIHLTRYFDFYNERGEISPSKQLEQFDNSPKYIKRDNSYFVPQEDIGIVLAVWRTITHAVTNKR